MAHVAPSPLQASSLRQLPDMPTVELLKGERSTAPRLGRIVSLCVTKRPLPDLGALVIGQARPARQAPVSSTTIATVLPRDSGSQPAAMAEPMALAMSVGWIRDGFSSGAP